MQVAELLDRAKLHTGSDGKTARQLGVLAGRVSEWRHHKRACPITTQIHLCRLAKLTYVEAWEHIEQAAGLGKFVAATVAFAAECAISIAIGFAPHAQALGKTPLLDRDNV